jgi:hypothetical protein
MTREEVMRAAERRVALLTIADVPSFGPSLEDLEVPRLYYLITECPIEVLDKVLLHDLDRCLKF